MKKFILPISLFLLALMTTSVNAQEPPATPDAPVLRDDNIRQRSIEMERIKRDANKKSSNKPAVRSDIETKYPQIKEDFEGIQLSQQAIIKAYSNGEKIDYKTISSSAKQINKHAKRLNSNLFTETKKKKKKDKEKKPKSVRDLIVELDNAIGAVITSKMFQNLRVVDPQIAEKTQADLMNVMRISSELSEITKKMK